MLMEKNHSYCRRAGVNLFRPSDERYQLMQYNLLLHQSEKTIKIYRYATGEK